jgi:magnesium transporter
VLSFFDATGRSLPSEPGGAIPAGAVWIDLKDPAPDEEAAVEGALGIDVPTREELHEIEASSRLYADDGVYVMTASVVFQSESDSPGVTAVTFMLARDRLVTVRYADPRAFPLCLARLKKGDAATGGAAAVLATLLEAIVDRTADFVERIQAEVDQVSHGVFETKGGVAARQRRLDHTLRDVGRKGELVSRCRETLYSLGRVLGFFALAAQQRKDDKGLRARIRTASRDVASLADQVAFLSSKIIFLLDATLGMISIQQAGIIKIFSVAAVVFLPPTLIASIYGMNFEFMPELQWAYGYPAALALMVAAAIVPYLYFKHRGWL